jgi:predicted nucleic acid-binding protein
MKILLDTNIVLDFLLQRKPFCDDAKEIFELIEIGKVNGYLCATSVTTIYYLISKSVGKLKADSIIKDLLQLFDIADVNKNVLFQSLKNNGSDFEDSVIYSSAEYFNIDVIITRDKKGFKQSNIDVLQPDIFLEKYINTIK